MRRVLRRTERERLVKEQLLSACDAETVFVSVFNVSYLFGPDVDMNHDRVVTPSWGGCKENLGFLLGSSWHQDHLENVDCVSVENSNNKTFLLGFICVTAS